MCSMQGSQGRVAASMRALHPQEGASGVGQAICHYADAMQVDTPALTHACARHDFDSIKDCILSFLSACILLTGP